MDEKSLAQIAYEAYAKHQGWKSYNGSPIPEWDNVKPDIKAGWEAAADAVHEFIYNNYMA